MVAGSTSAGAPAQSDRPLFDFVVEPEHVGAAGLDGDRQRQSFGEGRAVAAVIDRAA